MYQSLIYKQAYEAQDARRAERSSVICRAIRKRHVSAQKKLLATVAPLRGLWAAAIENQSTEMRAAPVVGVAQAAPRAVRAPPWGNTNGKY